MVMKNNSALSYEKLSEALSERIYTDRKNATSPSFAFDEGKAARRKDRESDRANVIRTPFIRDIDKIIHCPYYNRYADKTQVFSFYKNDDITRRALHVQLVSRIARTIGKALNLNLDLIEAIALGHDIGHTPFGHAGEDFLDALYFKNTGRHFSHNIHSVRVLDKIYPYNVSLQTLNGIAAHNGEAELSEYRPSPLSDFSEFDSRIEECYLDKSNIKKLMPDTLEGCVVRISDIISYLGKDRQDAARAHLISGEDFEGGKIGVHNAEIINNLIVNIVENSYGKPYIKMSDEHFAALKSSKKENYDLIYHNGWVTENLQKTVRPMMEEMYLKLLSDLENEKRDSFIFTHHIDYVNKAHYEREQPYESTEKNLIVVDYIASMTDDYFVDLYAKMFPHSRVTVNYKGYFD